MTVIRERTISTPVLQLAMVSVVVGTATAFALPFGSLFLTTEVGVSPLALGTFMLVSPLASVVASTVIGKLSDTGTRRRVVMVAAAIAGTIGYALFALLRDYWFLLAASVTFVAASTCLLPQMFAYGRQLDRAGPLVISTLRTLVSVAWVAGPPLAALLVSATGFRGLFGVTAALYVLVALVASRLPLPLVPVVDETETATGRVRGKIPLAVASFTFLQGATVLAVSGLPLFVTADLHGTAGDAGLVMGLCAALEIPMIMGLGVLATRIDLHRLVMAGALVGLGYHALMLMTSSVWQVFAAQLLHAIGISAVMGVGISYFQSLEPDRPGHVTTLFSNTATAGTMIAGPLLGVAQQFGFRLTYAMSLTMCVLGLVLLYLTKRLSTRLV